MKSKQIKQIFLLLVISIFVAMPTHADEEGDLLPTPTTDVAKPEPAPQTAIPDPTQNNSVSTTPEEDLPPPNNGQPAEDNRLQVNKPLQNDDVFLPSPAAQDNITYTPMGNPVVPNSVYDTTFNPVGPRTRPPFSLLLGYANHTYASNLVVQQVNGAELGAEYRVWNIADTIFLSLFGSASWLQIGNVGFYQGVKDTTIHVGPNLQLDLGKRVTIFASLLYRSNSLSASVAAGSVAQLSTLHEEGKFRPGGGLQYDFYKTPHAAVGVRGYLEQAYASLLITLALEPIPNRKPEIDSSSGM